MILSPEDCQCPLVDEGPSIVNSPICGGYLLFMVLLEGYLKGRCNIADPCKRITSPEVLKPEYDFIVVGAGSAGSIVAGRLSENETFNVLLIEAGGPEPIGARVPSFVAAFWNNEKTDWNYRTVPNENFCIDEEDKGCSWPRGKVVGGTSILNGMMYHRGHSADYDAWVEAGAEGWSWDENMPYFLMTEGNKQIGSLVSADYHSSTGPLPVQQFNFQPFAAYELFKAVNETGIPVISDMNDPNTPEGFSVAQTFSDNGQRYSTARAYLKPKPNLHVLMNAHVTKVLMDGKQAVGVEYIDENGETKTINSTKEVILSAGALNSPQILMLSGIGPQETLDKFEIPVIQDLPVGKNFRNHYGISLSFLLTKANNTNLLDWNAFTQYILERKGPMSSTTLTQVTGMLYSSLANRTVGQPDIQVYLNGFGASCSRTGVIGEPLGSDIGPREVSTNTAILLPRSVGYLTINSSNPLDPPLFYPEFFSHPDDMVMIKDAVKYIQRIVETDILQNKYGIILEPNHSAPCSNKHEEWSDSWVECMARVHTDPQNHQLGTAAIGLVIDPELKVYNITGLRVIDASSMPIQTTGNIQGPIMMIAERGATLIKEEWA